MDQGLGKELLCCFDKMQAMTCKYLQLGDVLGSFEFLIFISICSVELKWKFHIAEDYIH